MPQPDRIRPRARLLFAVPLILAACAAPAPADDQAGLHQATLEALPGIDATAIQISDAVRASSKWTWTATISGKSYACDADDQMRLPSCTPRA
jgi:hypothetical protein